MIETLLKDAEAKEGSSNSDLDVWIDTARLEYFMEREGVDLNELARRTGMHYNNALRIKIQKTTSFKGLSKVSKALNCHPFDLLVAQGFPEPFWVAPVSH